MVFALVHFATGFVVVLFVLCVIPITRYRLTGAYVGGVWALGPDVHQLLTGSNGELVSSLHSQPVADLFFFHRTLDSAGFEAHNLELTFLAIAALGLTFVLYDWQFGRGRPPTQHRESTVETGDARQSD